MKHWHMGPGIGGSLFQDYQLGSPWWPASKMQGDPTEVLQRRDESEDEWHVI